MAEQEMAGATVPGAAERESRTIAQVVTCVAVQAVEELLRRAEELEEDVRREAREGLGRRQREAVAWILDGVVQREIEKRMREAEEMVRAADEARERAEALVEEARKLAEDARERAEKAEEDAREARRDGQELRRMGESLRQREVEMVERVVRRATE